MPTRHVHVSGGCRLPEPDADRVDAGLDRGRASLVTFALAMAHELESNAHKGAPDDTASIEHVRELLYHALKLYCAVVFGHREAVLEYAADCGNHAWMAAQSAHCLDLDLLTPSIEGGGSVGLYDHMADAVEELAGRAAELHGLTLDPVAPDPDALDAALRDAPWTVKAEHGGFYDDLKTLGISFSTRAHALVDECQARAGRRTPKIRDALGARNGDSQPQEAPL